MSEETKGFKVQAWMILVGVFAVLIGVGIFTS
jgi:hypothetical protein